VEYAGWRCDYHERAGVVVFNNHEFCVGCIVEYCYQYCGMLGVLVEQVIAEMGAKDGDSDHTQVVEQIWFEGGTAEAAEGDAPGHRTYRQ
jgi:hypothetical protein